MAGVPGQTPAQKLALLKAEMQPGDYIMDGQIVRAGRRDRDQSALGTIGQFADKYLGVGDDRRRSRILSGIASQWYGLDDAGNPTFGTTPGIVSETKSLGALPTMLARAGLDKYIDELGPLSGLGDDPTNNPMYKLVRDKLLSDPEWASTAASRADNIHKAVREDMGLAAPRGFKQNAEESLGVMLGQVPIPGKLATKGAEAVASAKSGALDAALKGAEWFTPTVDPKASNYAIGAITGGGIGSLGDEPEAPPVVVPGDQPGLYDVRPTYEDGSVGYSGNAQDQEELQQLEAEGHASGGKVTIADKLIRRYLKDAGRSADGTMQGNNNSATYLTKVRKLLANAQDLPTERDTQEFLEGWAHEPTHLKKPDWDRMEMLVNDYGIELPPDIPLYRGVAAHGRALPPKVGQRVSTTQLPLASTTEDELLAAEYAQLFGAHEGNLLLNVGRKSPVKAFPLVHSGEDEWLLPIRGQNKFTVTGVKQEGEQPLFSDVDVDYTQTKKLADGGRVGDLDKLIAKYLHDSGEGKGQYIGNGKRYMELARRHVKSVPEGEEAELLEDYIEGPWGWSENDKRKLFHLVDRHAVEVAPDVQLHRGVSAANPEMFDPDWTPGREVKHTDLSVIPSTTSRGMAYDFATMIGDSPNNAVLNFNSKKPYRAMPVPMSGQDEWLMLPGRSIVTKRKHIPGPFKSYDDIQDVDVDFDQYPTDIKLSKGGDVNKIDKCDGGMSSLSGLRAKYAAGGAVAPEQTIQTAIAHLDRGDTPGALAVLQSNPAATRDPGVAAAMAKIQGYAKGGLTAKARNSLPDSKFAGPGRSYPVEDKSHASNAKGRAKHQLDKGNLSTAGYSKIVAKANKVLGRK